MTERKRGRLTSTGAERRIQRPQSRRTASMIGVVGLLASCLAVVAGSATAVAAPLHPSEGAAATTAHEGVVTGSIDAGGAHTCGIKTDGTVACWGANQWAQTTAPAGTFTAVTAGGNHTCGIKSDGTAACWGHNAYGQSPAPAGTFKAVTAGDLHTCGIKSDGTVACWGNNGSGQSTAPAGTFTALSAGGYHTCGIKTAGAVACWGSNAEGQSHGSPTTTTLTVVKTATKIKVSGNVSPAHADIAMVVTLFKKRAGGGWAKLETKRPRLNASSAYATSFIRPRAGSYKVRAKFPGDDHHRPSVKSKRFSLK